MKTENMTYEELAEVIQAIPPERRKDNVSIWIRGNDEYYPVAKSELATDTDALDEGHLVLVV